MSPGRGRARSSTWPSTRTASAAFASPGPIAFARSAPVEPAARRFSLPSGSVTWISAAGISSVRALGGGGLVDRGGRASTRKRWETAAVFKVEREGERDQRAHCDPADDAAGGQDV